MFFYFSTKPWRLKIITLNFFLSILPDPALTLTSLNSSLSIFYWLLKDWSFLVLIASISRQLFVLVFTNTVFHILNLFNYTYSISSCIYMLLPVRLYFTLGLLINVHLYLYILLLTYKAYSTKYRHYCLSVETDTEHIITIPPYIVWW